MQRCSRRPRGRSACSQKFLMLEAILRHLSDFEGTSTVFAAVSSESDPAELDQLLLVIEESRLSAEWWQERLTEHMREHGC